MADIFSSGVKAKGPEVILITKITPPALLEYSNCACVLLAYSFVNLPE